MPEPVRVATVMEKTDWADTPLGPMSDWPSCLKSVLDIILPAQAQIVLFWGEDFIALYNDAYAPTIGNKHPAAFGRPARENWRELWDDLEPLLRRVLDQGETVFARDRPFKLERHGYPETVYFDISYSPIRDETATVRGVLCIVSETTDRVRFERALQASEERLRAIVTQSAAGIALGDLDGRLLSVNKRFCEIVGYAEEELVGMRMQDITFADDLPENLRLFRRMVETGQSFDIEKRYVRKDGGLVWVANSVSALRDGNGIIREAAAFVVDITDRKQAQEIANSLAAIIASSNDAILGIDLDMTITSWNAAAERLYGYTSAEAIGRSVLILVPDDRKDEEPAILQQVSAGLKVEPYETKRRRKDGNLVDVLLSVSPILGSSGKPIGASKIAHDITARKQAERLRTVLVGELSHRVKNVLATVIAIARQTLGRDEATREKADSFEARLTSMARAHDLLLQGDWQRANLHAVIEQALSPYPPERFVIEGPPLTLPPTAAVSFSLALHELATNAAKYGALSVPEGIVSIRWTATDGPSHGIRLRWQEMHGPAVLPPTRTGFGSRLVERLLASELGGEARITYFPEGVVCEIEGSLTADGHEDL